MRRAWLLGAAALALGCGSGSASDDASAADSGAGDAGVGDAAARRSPCGEARFGGSGVGSQCGELVDADGRVVFVHGVNARVAGLFDVSFDDGRLPLEPIPDWSADDARQMAALGFDALRLPLNWSAIEPEDGAGFVDAYLDRAAAVVADCDAAGLRVLLDLHQDAYSKEIGQDGAPLWAIVPAPTELLGGPLTDLTARRTSLQVLKAFDTFFGTTDDGTRLRARFAAMAAHVATRFAGDARVLGLEAFNEPQASEAGLQALHQAVTAAVHAVDPTRLVLFEPSAVRNLKDTAPLASYAPAAGSVYAPHVYTLVFSGSAADKATPTKAKLAPSVEAARAEADSWKTPLVITEWGDDPNASTFHDYATWLMELMEGQRASWFFWVWKEDSEGSWGLFDRTAGDAGAWAARTAAQAVFARPMLEAVPGWPTSIAYDDAARTLTVAYDGDAAIAAPALVFVPAGFASATCDGAPVALAPAANGRASLACNGDGAHTLRVGP